MLKRILLPFLLAFVRALPTAKPCRCRPSDPCWPSHAEWQQLNRTANGNLQLLKPVGAVCHGSQYDTDACEIVRSQQHSSSWRTDHPGLKAATNWPNWEMWPEKGEICYIEGEKSTHDIQAGIRFAGKYNLRVAVRNTGHDFASRSVAPESLQINTHLMKDMNVHKDFEPSTCNGEERGLAVTIGAGVQLYETYKWLGDEGLMVVRGSSHGVGLAGGYTQGGGHSMLAASHGMASDNALEFTVVTANGEHVTANDFRAFEDPPIVTFSLTGWAANEENYWAAIEHIHAFLPEFNDAGGSRYYYLIPDLPGPSLGKIYSFTAHKIAKTPWNYSSTFMPKASNRYTIAYEASDRVGELVIFSSRIIT
ncbi:hypothetical protein GQ44DRAFT_826355 [Phaeosphaeriaceae sp. PMI808]|nr:hypothetical protein GQ44DRAFT_826355 [Phaeosphaeriaceae sp. PMI808]